MRKNFLPSSIHIPHSSFSAHGKTADRIQNPPSFETAITRLEQLVEEMDSANLPLQDLITAMRKACSS